MLKHNLTGVDGQKLAETLLNIDGPGGHPWRDDCEIVVNYVPPRARPDGRSRCVVRHIPSGQFLRWSAGVYQGYFWDCYGEDCLSLEYALIALSQAPAPRCITYQAAEHVAAAAVSTSSK